MTLRNPADDVDRPRSGMTVGVALPTMARGWTRSTLVDWCDLIDAGPFSSISCGERMTYHNPEMLTTMGAAAGRCERATVFLNLAVAPWHATAMLAKQVATLDVLTDGRVELGLGVGGRREDFEALGATWARRHQRLDEQVGELRRWWAGERVLEGAPPLGPPAVRPGGPPLFAGASGPKALARAARWADGNCWFDFNLDEEAVLAGAAATSAAWAEAGRSEAPRFKVACFASLGDGAAATLAGFTADYLAIFGRRFSTTTAESMRLHDPGALGERLERLAGSGRVDEVIVVPATTDPTCGELLADVVADLPGAG